MSEVIPAYPLSWPAGWRRIEPFRRSDGPFRTYRKSLAVVDGVTRVREELRQMLIQADDIVISTNMPLRLDGWPRSNVPEPSDPGAAVYWRSGKSGARCMAIDRYTTVADNLAAIAATLKAMRAIERHGGALILDRVFQGFTALPAPFSWWQELGLDGPQVSQEAIATAHRRLAMRYHPDRPDGDGERMARINRARDLGLEATQ